jgi:hypothetical protein
MIYMERGLSPGKQSNERKFNAPSANPLVMRYLQPKMMFSCQTLHYQDQSMTNVMKQDRILIQIEM